MTLGRTDRDLSYGQASGRVFHNDMHDGARAYKLIPVAARIVEASTLPYRQVGDATLHMGLALTVEELDSERQSTVFIASNDHALGLAREFGFAKSHGSEFVQQFVHRSIVAYQDQVTKELVDIAPPKKPDLVF